LVDRVQNEVCSLQARQNLQWAITSSFTRFLDHTQRRNTVDRLLCTSDQQVAETST